MKRFIQFRYVLAFLCIMFGVAASAQQARESKINIIEFKVVKSENTVRLNWATDGKVSTNYFEVEKSDDGKAFKTVAYILGADPSKTNEDSYGCVDKENADKKWYYRLKHVSANGETEFSEIKMLALK